MLLAGEQDFSPTISLLWECCSAALLPWTEALQEVIAPEPKAELSGFHGLVILHGLALRD